MIRSQRLHPGTKSTVRVMGKECRPPGQSRDLPSLHRAHQARGDLATQHFPGDTIQGVPPNLVSLGRAVWSVSGDCWPVCAS